MKCKIRCIKYSKPAQIRSNSIPIPQSPHFFWSVLNSERGLLVLISRNKNSYSLTETLDNLFGKSMNFQPFVYLSCSKTGRELRLEMVLGRGSLPLQTNVFLRRSGGKRRRIDQTENK